MQFDKSLPNWPAKVVDALAAVQHETPKGCGGCIHADWIAAYDASTPPGNFQQKITFGLGACRADIRLGVSINGLRPVVYCTAWNQPTTLEDEGTADPSDSASVKSAVDRVVPPVTGSHRRLDTNLPSIATPSGSKLFGAI